MIDWVRTNRAGAVLAALGVSVCLAACGGDDDEDTKTQVNNICKQFSADTKSLGGGSVSSLEDFAREGKKVEPNLDETLKDLQAVKPDSDVPADDYNKLVQNFSDTTDVFKQMVAAAEQGDQDTFAAGGTELERLDGEADAISKKLGFDDCVGSGS